MKNSFILEENQSKNIRTIKNCSFYYCEIFRVIYGGRKLSWKENNKKIELKFLKV